MRIGRYEIVGELGRGGQGTVYDAVLDGPGGFRRPVALKVVGRGPALVREARLGGLLRHPHLVDCYEVGEHDGTWFLAMERCGGGSLHGRGPLPPRAVVEVGLAVCDALHYAHGELGLVHLDLKPANLLLDGGVVKVADLGIARSDEAPSRRGLGTFGYMAPEQARGGPVDARADVYALGVVLRELASGARPGAAWTMSPTDAPAQAAESVPVEVPWLAPILARCLAEEPADRFASMAELAAALRALPVEGPSLATVVGAAATARLPEREAPVVGRASELARIAEHLAQPGVVTVLGAPGVGKTAVALAAARRHRDAGGQVAVCELGDAEDLEGLLAVVAAALDVPLGTGAPDAHAAQLGRAIGARGDVVVVLDGADRAIGPLEVVATWRTAAPSARFVVTSRRPCGLPGEAVVRVEPMTLPDGIALVRARARERGVALPDDEPIARLVERLDGVPLALELAAGRLGVLSLDEVVARLSVSILRSGRAGAVEREASLAGALRWSTELLDEGVRGALGQLSVFRGGFTAEAVEAVVALGPGSVTPSRAVEVLLERSLVTARGGRMRLLEPVRAWAEELVDRSARQRAEARHGAFFARAGAPGAIRALAGHGGLARRSALAAELDDVVVACERAIARGDASVGVPTCLAACEILLVRGPWAAALRLCEGVLPLAPDAVVDRLSDALRLLGRPSEARERLERALADRRAAGDRPGQARALHGMAIAANDEGRMDDAQAAYEAALAIRIDEDPASATATLANLSGVHFLAGRLGQARSGYEAAIARCRASGDRRQEAMALLSLGSVHLASGDLDGARARYEDAVAVLRELSDRRNEALGLVNLAQVALEVGRGDEAEAHLLAARAIARQLGDRRGEAAACQTLGVLAQRRGRMDEADRHYDAAVRLAREVGDRRAEGGVLANQGVLYAELGRPDEARALLDAALPILRQTRNRRAEARAVGCLGDLALASGRIEEARAAFEQALGIHGAIDDRAHEGATLGRLAEVVQRGGDLSGASALLDRGERVLREVGHPSLLAELLCARARVAIAGGRLADARSAADEARAIVDGLGVEAGRIAAEVAALGALAQPVDGG